MTFLKDTPTLSRASTDSTTDEELDRTLRTPLDRPTSHQSRIVCQGQLVVPAHSPNDEFVGTPFSTSNVFEYPFHPDESKDGKRIIVTTGAPAQYPGYTSTGSGSPSSPHYVRALREVSKEAPIPPSLREKVTVFGA